MNPKELRAKVFTELNALGFHPAGSLPFPDVRAAIRPAADIAARLMALDALYAWVVVQKIEREDIQYHINQNQLRDWMTDEETQIIDSPREDAHAEHVNTIGWKLENMWPLAWALGFDRAPGLAPSQIDDDVIQAIYDFLPKFGESVDEFLANCSPRSAEELIAMEYFFFCAHNAVRSAQLGAATVPDDFNPIVHGGTTHERRHALSWCLAPDVSWEHTELST